MRAITQDQMKFVKVNGEQMFNEKKKKEYSKKKKKIHSTNLSFLEIC